MNSEDRLPDALVVRRAVTRMARRLLLERKGGSISPSKLRLLGHLRLEGALSPSELAAREHVRPQTLTRLLTDLETEGMVVRRHHDGDRRRVLVCLTDEGIRRQNEDMRQRDAWLEQAMAAQLTPVEREVLRLAAGVLERLAAADSAPELRSVS
jgi:DNA-binding MarR family transcriptional regulator